MGEVFPHSTDADRIALRSQQAMLDRSRDHDDLLGLQDAVPPCSTLRYWLGHDEPGSMPRTGRIAEIVKQPIALSQGFNEVDGPGIAEAALVGLGYGPPACTRLNAQHQIAGDLIEVDDDIAFSAPAIDVEALTGCC